jgi:hypothetical protein
MGLHVDCGTMFKGLGVTFMAFTLFIGSVYLFASLVLGKWMGYLLVMVAFSGWMIIFSFMWLTGFWISQGPTTPKNLGPRGQEAAWVPLSGGVEAASNLDPKYATFQQYPNAPWEARSDQTDPSVQSASGVASSFLAAQANAQLGIDPLSPSAITGTQMVVDKVSFAPAADGKTSLAVIEGHYSGGGPKTTIAMYHNNGSVPRYSIMFLIASLLLFFIHLPLLDRAEKKRKAFLVGGTAPAWYGPA